MAHSIEHLLVTRGLPVHTVAKMTGVTRRWIYEQCKIHNYPRNCPINPGSRLETEICKALVGFKLSIPTVARLFNQAPINIKKAIASVATQQRKLPSPR